MRTKRDLSFHKSYLILSCWYCTPKAAIHLCQHFCISSSVLVSLPQPNLGLAMFGRNQKCSSKPNWTLLVFLTCLKASFATWKCWVSCSENHFVVIWVFDHFFSDLKILSCEEESPPQAHHCWELVLFDNPRVSARTGEGDLEWCYYCF